jgi:hypothetical protein
MFPVFSSNSQRQLFLDILDWHAFAVEFNPLANHDEFNLASDSIRRLPFDELVWVGSETERVVFFLFHVSLAALTGRWKARALLFFIETKAVQNAMGERRYDHGCYSDKSQSGKQSITGSKYLADDEWRVSTGPVPPKIIEAFRSESIQFSSPRE